MTATWYTIPVSPGVPDQVQTTTLEGRPFVFRFQWIQRIDRWIFDLETGSGTAIVRCKGLALGGDLLRQVQYRPEAPQGLLTVVDLEGKNEEPTLSSLGARHRVAYVVEG